MDREDMKEVLKEERRAKQYEKDRAGAKALMAVGYWSLHFTLFICGFGFPIFWLGNILLWLGVRQMKKNHRKRLQK